MIFATGAESVTSERDYVQRCGLLADELEMGGADVDELLAAIHEEEGAGELPDALNLAESTVAVDLIRRFSAAEASIAGPGLKGLGRVSPKGFPRLGGVLAKEATKRGVAQDDVTRAVERTVQASFLAAWLVAPGLAKYPRIDDAETVWQRWIPGAYRPPEDLMESVFNLCAVETFWNRTLELWGLSKAHKQMSKMGSDLGRSIGGLAGVGLALAFAERSDVEERAEQSR